MYQGFGFFLICCDMVEEACGYADTVDFSVSAADPEATLSGLSKGMCANSEVSDNVALLKPAFFAYLDPHDCSNTLSQHDQAVVLSSAHVLFIDCLE